MLTLTAAQTRVIGVMLEKEITTPDLYPLSLNALTNGCNQKSNRDPVLSLSENQVLEIVDELIELKQVFIDTGSSGRVNKYKHRFCNTQFGTLQLTAQQKSIICVLFLRGPQTAGELRTRTSRLADFANVTDVENALEQLQNIDRDALVKKLARQPGKRDARYCHLFLNADDLEIAVSKGDVEAVTATAGQSDLETRVELLEQQVNELQAQLAKFSELLE